MNPILDTDSYKPSHWLQLPPDTKSLYLYMSARYGSYPQTLWFGLQYILREQLSRRITRQDVDEAEAIVTLTGEPFNRKGWEHILSYHAGHWPITICALPEGTLVPHGVPVLTVESTDSRVPWVASYVETMLMRAWYPSTVATVSFYLKQKIRQAMLETSDDLSGLPFKLHDFGSRGVSSRESAAIGGLAHLVNFMGTDTMAAIMCGRKHYQEPMAGFSIPASEHGTITAWGREGEEEAYANMIDQFGKPGKVFACVSDTYDVFNATENLWGGSLRQKVIDSGATLVIRPDSGDPTATIMKLLGILEAKFGVTRNSKGFKVLNHVRLIQGDLPAGISDVTSIIMCMTSAGYSADNIAYGMGGALLQKVNRDTQGFAMKTSAVFRDDRWVPVSKSAPGKVSLSGLVGAKWNGNTPQTTHDGDRSAMNIVFVNGRVIQEEPLSAIRERTEKYL